MCDDEGKSIIFKGGTGINLHKEKDFNWDEITDGVVLRSKNIAELKKLISDKADKLTDECLEKLIDFLERVR